MLGRSGASANPGETGRLESVNQFVMVPAPEKRTFSGRRIELFYHIAQGGVIWY